MDRREAERDKREAERDRLAREVDLQAYKANRENRVTLLQAVRAQRASFDDRGENDDVFPDAYIKYLSGLTGASSLSDDGKIIEKARELYTKHEPIRCRPDKWGYNNGPFGTNWVNHLETIDYGGRRHPASTEKRNEYILKNWLKEKQRNSVIFKEYVNMAKKDMKRPSASVKQVWEDWRIEQQKKDKQDEEEVEDDDKDEEDDEVDDKDI
jgi:hypothetical protein